MLRVDIARIDVSSFVSPKGDIPDRCDSLNMNFLQLFLISGNTSSSVDYTTAPFLMFL
jgi:hypothetical protein